MRHVVAILLHYGLEAAILNSAMTNQRIFRRRALARAHIGTRQRNDKKQRKERKIFLTKQGEYILPREKGDLVAESDRVSVENGTDLVLVLLFAGGAKKTENEEIIGNTRLDKLMFLLEKETTLKRYMMNIFRFDAYNFGPYSSELFDSVQALVNAGLVSAGRSESEEYLNEADRYQIELQLEDNTQSPKTATIYSLTPEGKIVASQLFQSLSESERQELVAIKKMFNSISLKKLLQYIYRKYPESATLSIIREQITAE